MDPYVYPETNVLRNLWDVRDLEELSRLEAIATSRRLTELHNSPPPGKFDHSHLKAIHRHIFQDIFSWAGEFRTVNIARSNQFYFAFHEQIVPCVNTLLAKLTKERHLADLNLVAFCNRGAYYLGELNAIHPFREGNGRTQREFIRQLALRNGHVLHWTRVSREQMYEASHKSFQRADSSGLEQVLRSALDE